VSPAGTDHRAADPEADGDGAVLSRSMRMTVRRVLHAHRAG
jgi:hypothetical protein